ncbi:MAG: hypothetical protein JW836_12315 [Deltaproteobacteria bacterium]|nr:hypothetical protein [Deltaproteobacteria bacterium]
MSGVIEVDLFDKHVDREDHPEALKFRKLLQKVAKDFKTNLVSFKVHEGTISFAFDDDELTAEILKVLEEKG